MKASKKIEKGFKIIKNEVLVGSAILKDKKLEKKIDRVLYMIENMHENKAFIFKYFCIVLGILFVMFCIYISKYMLYTYIYVER